MKDIGRKITLLEKKLQIIDNDLLKLVYSDLIEQNLGQIVERDTNKGLVKHLATTSLESLKKKYKDELHELRKIHSGKTKQLTIDSSVNEK